MLRATTSEAEHGPMADESLGGHVGGSREGVKVPPRPVLDGRAEEGGAPPKEDGQRSQVQRQRGRYQRHLYGSRQRPDEVAQEVPEVLHEVLGHLVNVGGKSIGKLPRPVPIEERRALMNELAEELLPQVGPDLLPHAVEEHGVHVCGDGADREVGRQLQRDGSHLLPHVKY